MDMERWAALTALVREARQEDARTLAVMNEATSAWKAANGVLTDRIKVLDGFVADAKNRDTAL